MATIGRRLKEESGLSDGTCTPKWLADMLPVVDFDPCSNPRSHIKSSWTWSLEKGYDGLRMPWHGTGFINWPFAKPLPWANKAMIELGSGRCTDLIILCKLDPSTKWWSVATAFDSLALPGEPISMAPELWLFNDRVQYDEHPELIEKRRQKVASGERKGKPSGESSNNFCSVIIHHRGWLPAKTGEQPKRNNRLKLDSVAALWCRTWD